jgi:hypothetical protein
MYAKLKTIYEEKLNWSGTTVDLFNHETARMQLNPFCIIYY